MNSVVLWIGGLLVAVLGLLFAVPYFVDWNSYRGVFEEEASRVLGREVRLGGAVNLRLLPMPYVRFEKLRIANADGRTGEPLFRAEAFTLWLSVSPLLRGIVEANQVELDRPVLRLATGPDGTGNWQNFHIAAGSLPFVPADVALQSVKVRDGTLVIDAGAGQAILSKINGELEAAALAGPYRLRADAMWDGVAREVRLSTGVRDPDGSLRSKLTVRVPQNGNSYSFDGVLTDLWGRVRYDGAGTARLMLGAARKDDAFEVQSVIKGDALAADVTDITVSYEKDGKPQTLSGEAHATWARAPRVTTAWQAKWLDLDGLLPAGDGGGSGPLALAKDLGEQAAAWIPSSGEVRASLDVEQINIGGDAVTGLRLAASGSDGVVRIDELRAGLPGSARVDLKGSLVAKTAQRAFEGDLVLRGASLQRFMGWAARANASDFGRSDGTFLMAGRLGVSASRVGLSDVDVEFNGSRMRATLDYGWEPQPAMALQLIGDTVDLSSLAPGLLDPDAVLATMGEPSTAAGPQGSGLARLLMAARRNLKLSVKAAELNDGSRTLRDVDATIASSGQQFDIKGLRFTTVAGAKIELEGSLRDPGGSPKGTLRGSLNAVGADAIGDLKELLGNGSGLPQLISSAVTDARVAVSAGLGQRAPQSLDVRVDGVVGGNRVIAQVVADGGVKQWRSAPIDLHLNAEGPDARRLLQLLPGASGALKDMTSAGRAARLDVTATGPSMAALGTLAEFKSEPLTASFAGTSKVGDDNALEFDGEASVAVANVADVLTAYGIKRPPALGGVAIDGVVGVRRNKDSFVIEPRGLAVAGASVSGTVQLGGGNGAPIKIDGDMRADRTALAGLLRLIEDGRTEASRAGAIAAANDNDAWPDLPLDLSVLEGIEGRVVLSAGTLGIAPGIEFTQARLAATIKPGRIDISAFDGVVLGGAVKVTATIERAAAGVVMSADIGADALQLAGLEFAGAARGKGTAGATLRVEGRALSARALIGSMAGRGELKFAGAVLPGVSIDQVRTAAEGLLAGTEPPQTGALVRLLNGATGAGGTMTINNRTLALQVADGAIKVAPLIIETPRGKARNVTTVDLTALKADSEWRIELAPLDAKRPGKAALPGVSIVYLTPLAALTNATPRIDADTLERELTVVRMERDIERLEQQRRLDAERARTQSAIPVPPAPEAAAAAPAPVQNIVPAASAPSGEVAQSTATVDGAGPVTPAAGGGGEVQSAAPRSQPQPRPARRLTEPSWQEKVIPR